MMAIAIGGLMMLFAGLFSYCILLPYGLQNTNFGIYLILLVLLLVMIMGLMLLTIVALWGDFLRRFPKQKRKFVKALTFLADFAVILVSFSGVMH